jgi:hypothetical protein
MIIQKSNDKPLQFNTNLEKIIIRTFEIRFKNTSCNCTSLFNYIFKADLFRKSFFRKSHDFDLTWLEVFFFVIFIQKGPNGLKV